MTQPAPRRGMARRPTDASRDADDERGAILIIVSVAMVALLGMAAMAVDLGMAWSSDRQLNTATDAAALAGAVEVLDGGSAEEAEAACQNYLLSNHPDAQGVCEVDMENNTISVDATASVEYAFAPILGIDDGTTRSFSEATLLPGGAPSGIASGLRPFAFCLSSLFGMEGFTDWAPPAPSDPIVVEYGKDDNSGCGGGSANWGTVDFDGGDNSNSTMNDWIANGFDGSVWVDPDGTNYSCPNGTDDLGCYFADVGALSGSHAASLNSLIGSGPFTVPIYDSADDASGQNVVFHLVAIARIELVDFKVTGKAEDRWLEVIFVPGEAEDGICCDETPPYDFGVTAPGNPSLTGLG